MNIGTDVAPSFHEFAISKLDGQEKTVRVERFAQTPPPVVSSLSNMEDDDLEEMVRTHTFIMLLLHPSAYRSGGNARFLSLFASSFSALCFEQVQL